MAQPPFQVDGIQIEPGATGTRTVTRDTTDGGLKFIDPNVTAVLKDLVGLRRVTGLYVVGRAGDGAPYTSIQDALDAIPDSASATAPALVWVLPGVYEEDLQVRTDGTIIASPGGAKIVNASADHTITIRPAIETTPLLTVLYNLTIVNDEAGQACVRIDGSDQFASGTLTVVTAPLAVGDTFTINGVVFTGVASTRTSGNDDFSVSGGTPAAVAAEIAAAINDSANSLYQVVQTSVVGPVVTVTAYDAGVGGNAITLAVATTPAGGITVSGATLTGGGADGSPVASQGVYILDCDLDALEYQISAYVCNNVLVRGGTWRDSSATSRCLVSQCALFRVWDVEWTNRFELSYDTAGDEPSSGTSEYAVGGCGRADNFIVDLNGLGSLTLTDLPVVGDITIGGDRPLSCTNCSIGDLSLADTVAVTLSRSSRGSLTLAGGTPTLAESVAYGSAAFVAAATVAVAFTINQPDANYFVLLENPQTVETLGVSGKAVGGFNINASGNITGTVGYAVMRSL